ncbi:hypothetical protein D8884_08390 [Streptococcus sanguinis]|nr:hypothetical protein D8889_03340 [Streptococcus sanguinis]RSI17383.1 hypothetical protein D8884_08390 [Streptococcus sanguinis]
MFKVSVLFCRFILDKICKGDYTIFEKQSLFYIAERKQPWKIEFKNCEKEKSSAKKNWLRS